MRKQNEKDQKKETDLHESKIRQEWLETELRSAVGRSLKWRLIAEEDGLSKLSKQHLIQTI